MNSKGACLACRIRKVKCVRGPAERCERCTTLGMQDCIFEGIKKRGVGKTLRMREACRRCRERKRKCDAKRPCSTCIEADSAPECEYQLIATRPLLSEHTQFIFLIQPDTSSSTDVTTTRQVARPALVETPVVTSSRSMPKPKSAPPVCAPIGPLGSNSFPFFPPPVRRPQNGTRDILSHLSVLSSFIVPSIPPEPRVTLSSFSPERFQLSDVLQGQLDMKFRLSVICRLGKLGLRFTPEKQQALLDGDISGAIIHPFFIRATHPLGMHFCEGINHSPAMVTLYAQYVQRSLELLIEVIKEISPNPDWELQAQVALWVTSGSIIMRLHHVTPTYIKKACEAVNLGGLRFVPSYGRPPPFSDALHEKLSVLSQIIYFDNFWFLACGGPQPTLTAKIEEEFSHQLEETYPVLFNICPLIMRTKGILLVRDTVFILSIRPTEEARLDSWRRYCHDLVTTLDLYSQTLLSNFQRFRRLGDKSGSEIILSCCINCFAHLAALCDGICQVGPAREEMNILCDSALEQLSGLTQGVCPEEYTRLDLLLGLSWKKALAIFDSRIANTTLEHSTRLSRCKEAVEAAYSDFLEKMPDADPPILFAHVLEIDGRTEESRYPNLLLPWVQRRYGI